MLFCHVLIRIPCRFRVLWWRDIMATNESLITDAAALGIIADKEDETSTVDIRFTIAIATTLVALLLIAFSKFH